MALKVKFFNGSTGVHERYVGDTWMAQDGPGPAWFETMVPKPNSTGKLSWYPVGRDLEHEQVDAIADAVHDAAKGCDNHEQAKEAARRRLEDLGLWDMIQAQA